MNAFIVVDMQNDFIMGSLGSNDAVKILPNVQQAVIEAKERGDEVIFTQDTHGEDYLSTSEGKHLPVVHCVKGTFGWEIEKSLAKYSDKVFEKPTFGSVQLAQYVKSRNFSKVTLVGVCTDICVVSNALLIKAFCPEKAVEVVAVLCAGTCVERHLAALDTMRSCQIEVL